MKPRALVTLGLLLAGCPKEDAAPEFDPKTDRTLQKLLEAQQRPPTPPPQPEPDPLAEVAANPGKPETLGIPSGVSADLGPVSLTLVEVVQTQSVGSGKVSLATTDRFVKVTLKATAARDFDLDVAGATLENGQASVPLARDAQRAGRGAALNVHLREGASEKVSLYFEAPPEMISKGLKIILTAPGSRVELALQ